MNYFERVALGSKSEMVFLIDIAFGQKFTKNNQKLLLCFQYSSRGYGILKGGIQN